MECSKDTSVYSQSVGHTLCVLISHTQMTTCDLIMVFSQDFITEMLSARALQYLVHPTSNYYLELYLLF